MAEQIPIGLRVSIDPAEAERTLVRFLKDYATDSGRPRFTIGLSGGIDSALAAALGVRAVGPENVHALILPDDATSREDLDDAKRVADWLKIPTSTHSIQPLLDAVVTTSGRLEPRPLGNVKARARMILLHLDAARREGLVLGTSNKSEALVGYATKYGDAGVDVQPLGDLYKTQVRMIASHLGMPSRLLEKAPSAGLWAGQTDEGELGITYERLDRILLGLELRLPLARIAAIVGMALSEVERVESLRRASQHKRRMPMAPKMGLRTVGVDWRAATLGL